MCFWWRGKILVVCPPAIATENISPYVPSYDRSGDKAAKSTLPCDMVTERFPVLAIQYSANGQQEKVAEEATINLTVSDQLHTKHVGSGLT